LAVIGPTGMGITGEIDVLRDCQRSRIGGDLDVPLVDEDVAAVDDERHQREKQRQRNHHKNERLAAFAPTSLMKFEQILPSERAASVSKNA
jgi:hypothetical protein